MALATTPTSIRLSSAEKRRISSLARKRGLTPSAYIKRAALAGPVQSEDVKLAHLERLATSVLETIQDERDARLADTRWEAHLAGKSRLLSRKEFRR